MVEQHITPSLPYQRKKGWDASAAVLAHQEHPNLPPPIRKIEVDIGPKPSRKRHPGKPHRNERTGSETNWRRNCRGRPHQGPHGRNESSNLNRMADTPKMQSCCLNDARRRRSITCAPNDQIVRGNEENRVYIGSEDVVDHLGTTADPGRDAGHYEGEDGTAGRTRNKAGQGTYENHRYEADADRLAMRSQIRLLALLARFGLFFRTFSCSEW